MLTATGITCVMCNGNALSIVDTDLTVPLQSLNLSDVSLHGYYSSAGQETGSIAWTVDANGGPQSITINGMLYDRIGFSYQGPACQTNYPQINVLNLSDVHTTSQSSASFDTIFNPGAQASTFTYIHARDSSLGRVSLTSVGTNNNSSLLDFPNVFTQGAITIGGGLSAVTYGPTTISQPLTSFTCPAL